MPASIVLRDLDSGGGLSSVVLPYQGRLIAIYIYIYSAQSMQFPSQGHEIGQFSSPVKAILLVSPAPLSRQLYLSRSSTLYCQGSFTGQSSFPAGAVLLVNPVSKAAGFVVVVLHLSSFAE